MAEGQVVGSDNALGWFIILVLMLILIMIIWYFNHDDIRSFLRWIRYGEIWATSWFVSDSYTVPWKDRYLEFEIWFEGIPNIEKQNITGEINTQIATLALYPFRWIFSGVFILSAIWCAFKGPNTQFRKIHTLGSLIKAQSKIFPYIAPFVSFNPSNQRPRPPGANVPAELPLFAEALGPEEWLAYEGVPVPDGKVNGNAAEKAFAKQLGASWRGWAHLPKHKQVLLASFCLKSVRKREESDTVLGELSVSWSQEKGLKISPHLLKKSRAILKNREISGKVLSLCNQHAYENTAMLRALLVARDEGGVLSPSQFVWLRAHDRPLWYPLNNLGRQTFHMEALGAMAHFRAEKLTQRPILRPRVGDAVTKIVEYMSSERARAVPPLDYSKSKKKRGIKKIRGT